MELHEDPTPELRKLSPTVLKTIDMFNRSQTAFEMMISPVLERLEIRSCHNLKNIPKEVGEYFGPKRLTRLHIDLLHSLWFTLLNMYVYSTYM